MIPQAALQRTFRIKYKEDCGTCFTIELSNKQYLVTAKHVVKGIKTLDQIELFHNNLWKPLKVSLVGAATKADVAVLAADFQISPTLQLPPSNGSQMILGQDVYFLGFPYNLFTEIEDNYDYPIPFAKKGIISSFYNAVEEHEGLIFLDGHNNSGFSGGPVIFLSSEQHNRDYGKRTYSFGAIISGFRYEHETIYHDGEASPQLTYRDNTGLIVAYNINQAIKLIEKNPIGFPVRP